MILQHINKLYESTKKNYITSEFWQIVLDRSQWNTNKQHQNYKQKW